jgi:predicted transcriptional regulator
MVKVTYTLDDETVGAIRRLAERQRKARSFIVREAIAAYASHDRRLDQAETARRLRVLDGLAGAPSTRSRAAVDAELRDVRRSRRTGWRRSSD